MVENLCGTLYNADFVFGLSLHCVNMDNVANVSVYLLHPSSGYRTLKMEAPVSSKRLQHGLCPHSVKTQWQNRRREWTFVIS
jgi:hypothetical protein